MTEFHHTTKAELAEAYRQARAKFDSCLARMDKTEYGTPEYAAAYRDAHQASRECGEAANRVNEN